MSEIFKILVVNPGSTSTKLAIFENERQIIDKKISHSPSDLAKYATTIEQVAFRRQAMDDFLKENNIASGALSAVVGRGGLLKPLPSGTYRVNKHVVEDLTLSKYGDHASNLGALLANSFTIDYGVPAFIVDPVIVDELQNIARYSGIKEINRRSVWHALNAMAVLRQTCSKMNFNINEDNFVVTHIGGGISVAAIKEGKCIDVSNGLDGGPFTPERAGTLPTIALVDLCFSGKYTKEEVNKLLVGKGGLVNYLGTNNIQEVAERYLEGNKEFGEVFEAMAYQIAKEIGSYVAVLKGRVKRIILTGGGANCSTLVDKVSEYIKTFAPVHVVPGEDELSALALGGLRVLRGEIPASEYHP